MNPVHALGDLATLRRAGILRPLGPRTAIAAARQVAREGVKTSLIYTIHGTRDAKRPAFLFEDRVTTWAQAAERIRRLANHLLARGVGPGDSVAIMLANRPEFIETETAALRVGALTAFINPSSPVADARSLLERTDAKLLVTHRGDLDVGVPVLRIGDDYEDAIASSVNAEPRIGRNASGKIVIFTSGTTGQPKGAVRSLDQSASPSTFAGFLRLIPFRTSDTHMVVCPLYHSSGSGFAAIAQALGNPLALVERFSPEAFCRTVAEHRVTTTTVVPTMLHQLCEWPQTSEYDLSSLRVVVCTGSPLREDLRSRARTLLGDVIYDLYGSTEMGWVSVATPDDQRSKPGSVGRPAPGVRVRITDPDGRVLERGEIGEIWVSSKLLMDEYLKDPDLTSQRVRDGFISVRDVGYLDADGYLYVVDRADDMLISGGVNVYPAEAEAALSEHPEVREVAVVGVPDPRWGQRVVAAVVPGDAVSEDELIDWCKERLSYASVPKEIRFVERLPRTDIGKVSKHTLADEWPDGSG